MYKIAITLLQRRSQPERRPRHLLVTWAVHGELTDYSSIEPIIGTRPCYSFGTRLVSSYDSIPS